MYTIGYNGVQTLISAAEYQIDIQLQKLKFKMKIKNVQVF